MSMFAFRGYPEPGCEEDNETTQILLQAMKTLVDFLCRFYVRIWSFLGIAVMLLALFALGAQPASASDGTFNISVYHGIKGRSLGLSKELPVDVHIHKDDELLTAIDNFTFQSRIRTSLPAGEYLIEVFSEDLQAFIPSMTVGPVDIPAGVKLQMKAVLVENQTPSIRVKIK